MKRKSRTQYAALPYRMREAVLEVLLITSRETGRWIIPKGWPHKGLSPSAVAVREAYEEAGLRGKIKRRPLGTYSYQKRLPRDKAVLCKVEVFALEVKRQLDHWPEQKDRIRCWLPLADAAVLVTDSELQELLLTLSGSLGRGVHAPQMNSETPQR